MVIECTEIESVLGPLRKGTDAISVGKICNALKSRYVFEFDWLGDNAETRDSFFEHARVAAFVAFFDEVPVLADGHPWSLLTQQAGGQWHWYYSFLGRRVPLKASVESDFMRIAHHWYGSDLYTELSHPLDGFPTLSQLGEYRTQLRQLGFDCDLRTTYSYFAEGLYPADLSQDALDRVCEVSFQLEEILAERKDNWQWDIDRAVPLFVAPSST